MSWLSKSGVRDGKAVVRRVLRSLKTLPWLQRHTTEAQEHPWKVSHLSPQQAFCMPQGTVGVPGWQLSADLSLPLRPSTQISQLTVFLHCLTGAWISCCTQLISSVSGSYARFNRCGDTVKQLLLCTALGSSSRSRRKNT